MKYKAEALKPPEPLVLKPRLAKHGSVRPVVRVGRGFSLGELREAKLNVKDARKLGLRVDVRRKSTRWENVEALRKFIGELLGKG